MSNENTGRDHVYGWNRRNLRVVGIWPEHQHGWISVNITWAWIFLIIIATGSPPIATTIYLWGNMDEVIQFVWSIFPLISSVTKMTLFRMRRNVLISILDLMVEDWSIPRTDDERQAMLKMSNIGKNLSIITVLMTSCLQLTYPSFRILLAVQEHKLITNETAVFADFLYPSYFPFNTRPMPRFLSIWVGQVVSFIGVTIGYTGPDSCVAMMVLHLCGQLATVKIALNNIVDEESVTNKEVYWKRLSAIVNSYGKLLEFVFSGMLLVQMVLCTITFCLQGFILLMGSVEAASTVGEHTVIQTAFNFGFMIYAILHLFIYCWVGDLLLVNSTAISRAPYESDWSRLSASQARALMIVTHRSRIPLQITAGKFVAFSLELFLSIMKTSMGYLSVLLAMRD